MRITLSIAALAILCAGCDSPNVTWYMQNDAERTAKIAECRDDPGFSRVDPACVNAFEALSRLMLAPGGNAPSIR